MKQILPYIFRKIGIAFFFISLLFTFLVQIEYYVMSDHPSVKEIIAETELQDNKAYLIHFLNAKQRVNIKRISFILSLSGLMLYAFSKEKVDDEFLAKLRANALLKSFVASWLIFVMLMAHNQSTKADMLGVLQIQMLTYVIVYAYTKKVKYAA